MVHNPCILFCQYPRALKGSSSLPLTLTRASPSPFWRLLLCYRLHHCPTWNCCRTATQPPFRQPERKAKEREQRKRKRNPPPTQKERKEIEKTIEREKKEGHNFCFLFHPLSLLLTHTYSACCCFRFHLAMQRRRVGAHILRGGYSCERKRSKGGIKE